MPFFSVAAATTIGELFMFLLLVMFANRIEKISGIGPTHGRYQHHVGNSQSLGQIDLGFLSVKINLFGIAPVFPRKPHRPNVHHGFPPHGPPGSLDQHGRQGSFSDPWNRRGANDHGVHVFEAVAAVFVAVAVVAAAIFVLIQVFYKGGARHVGNDDVFQWTLGAFHVLDNHSGRSLGSKQSLGFVPVVLLELRQDNPARLSRCSRYQDPDRIFAGLRLVLMLRLVLRLRLML